jgi:hypothetical protein
MALMPTIHIAVLSQEVYRALRAKAIVRNCGLQDAMNRLILDNHSQDAKKILSQHGYKSQEPQIHKATTPGIRRSEEKETCRLA